MKRMMFSVIFDSVFAGFAAFLILFVIFAGLMPKAAAVFLALALALGTCSLCFYFLYGRRGKGASSAAAMREKENLFFYLGLQKDNKKLFLAMLSALGKTAAIGKKGIYVRENDAYVYPLFSFDGVKKDDVAKAYVMSGGKKALLLAPAYSAEVALFARTFGDKIKLIGGEEVYALFKKADMLPHAALPENTLSKKEKLYAVFRTVFTRRRAPKYFLFGLTFLLFSFLVPYKLYYILFGTLLTVFSVICLFFAVPSGNTEANPLSE